MAALQNCFVIMEICYGLHPRDELCQKATSKDWHETTHQKSQSGLHWTQYLWGIICPWGYQIMDRTLLKWSLRNIGDRSCLRKALWLAATNCQLTTERGLLRLARRQEQVLVNVHVCVSDSWSERKAFTRSIFFNSKFTYSVQFFQFFLSWSF